MMMISSTKTVRELALEMPGATEVFEKIGIDYCCGGAQSLSEACVKVGKPIEQVLPMLEEIVSKSDTKEEKIDWRVRRLAKLTHYIVNKHHAFTRRELGRLSLLIAKVCSAHSARHPELVLIQSLFQSLEHDLLPHMHKEEQILFPYIERMEEAIRRSERMPTAFFGTVRSPIRMMMLEHDNAGELLRAIRDASKDFKVPEDGCASYELLYEGLKEFEHDLHQHIHLENNILFPRAIEMEDRDWVG
ncbi:MAG: iron-sulfur cluster repair di-iron protein [Acidobacteriota bacterium]